MLRRLLKAMLGEVRAGISVKSVFSVRSVMVLKRRTYISGSDSQ
jgi:hypothetical protein